MATFTVRMVLHKANWDDYTQLAVEMGKEGFIDVLTAGDGKRYKMPDAEYNGTAADKETALRKAQVAAARVGKEHAILVTKSNGRTWVGLNGCRVTVA